MGSLDGFVNVLAPNPKVYLIVIQLPVDENGHFVGDHHQIVSVDFHVRRVHKLYVIFLNRIKVPSFELLVRVPTAQSVSVDQSVEQHSCRLVQFGGGRLKQTSPVAQILKRFRKYYLGRV